MSSSQIERTKVVPTLGALSGTRELCLHYCRVGRCKHDSNCRYVHDRSKVSLCRANLRNECRKTPEECPLSHDLDPHRMPECGLFLRNMCVTPGCPYLHVKKASNAPDCDDFKSSWCPRGASCPKRHYVPPPEERKRQRPDADEEPPSEDEDNVLRRAWEETVPLNMYM